MVAILSSGAGAPHAIPVSTGVRAGDHRVLFALGRQRESLARLREDPRCALTLLAAGVACTARGRALVVQEPMAVSDRVAAVALDVDEVQDHLQPGFTIDRGVAWRWTQAAARAHDDLVRAALRELVGAP